MSRTPCALGRVEFGEQPGDGLRDPGHRQRGVRVDVQPGDQHEGPQMGERVRQRQVLVADDHLGFTVMARDEVHIEGARTPALIADPVGGALEFVRAAQPAVAVERAGRRRSARR